MIETDRQRRWWFATHPEFSWSHTGQERRGNREHDDRAEFASNSPGEKRLLLWVEDEARDQSGEDWWSEAPSNHPAASRDYYSQHEDALDRLADYRYQAWLEHLKSVDIPIEPDPITAFDVFPYARFLTSPTQAFRALLRSLARNTIVSAAKGAGTEGPGKWVEVCRSPIGIEHQSRMSGQPIRRSGGKLYIKEYEVPTGERSVYFDDFRDGKFYEYKGSYGKLLNKNNEFYEWFEGAEGARQEARRQVEAARGIMVIWRVGSDQVGAFEKALRGIEGIIIVP